MPIGTRCLQATSTTRVISAEQNAAHLLSAHCVVHAHLLVTLLWSWISPLHQAFAYGFHAGVTAVELDQTHSIRILYCVAGAYFGMHWQSRDRGPK